MSGEQAPYQVFSRQKNSRMGSRVGDPVLATSAEAACDKVKAKNPKLRRSRLFAIPRKQLELEEEERKKKETQITVDVEVKDEAAS